VKNEFLEGRRQNFAGPFGFPPNFFRTFRR
jgi:hypothetical protein